MYIARRVCVRRRAARDFHVENELLGLSIAPATSYTIYIVYYKSPGGPDSAV